MRHSMVLFLFGQSLITKEFREAGRDLVIFACAALALLAIIGISFICTSALSQVRSSLHASGEWCEEDSDCIRGLICADSKCWRERDYCSDSVWVKTKERCEVYGILCGPSPEELGYWWSPCLDDGQCYLRNDSCVVLSDRDCKNSRGCRENAHCTLSNGECVIKSTKDCLMHDGCKTEGLCKFLQSKDGETQWCVVGNNTDCRRSPYCKSEGYCNYCLDDENDGFPTCCRMKASDCARSELCTEHGHCGIDDELDCVPTREGHCRQSDRCRSNGWGCYFDPVEKRCTSERPGSDGTD